MKPERHLLTCLRCGYPWFPRLDLGDFRIFLYRKSAQWDPVGHRQRCRSRNSEASRAATVTTDLAEAPENTRLAPLRPIDRPKEAGSATGIPPNR